MLFYEHVGREMKIVFWEVYFSWFLVGGVKYWSEVSSRFAKTAAREDWRFCRGYRNEPAI